jgi:ABC-2 type transport system permease protein
MTDAASRAARLLRCVAGHFQRNWRLHRRSPLVITGTLAGPLLLLLAVGVGLTASLPEHHRTELVDLIVPGLTAMAVLLVASQHSVRAYGDRASGLTAELLAGPASRMSIVVGQAVATTVVAMTHAVVVFLVAVGLGLGGMPASWPAFLAVLLALSLACATGCTALGLAMRQPGAIQASLNLVVNPMFFLSGALFPIAQAPTGVQVVARVNPLHYPVVLLQEAYGGAGLLDTPTTLLAVAVLAATVAATTMAGARALVER